MNRMLVISSAFFSTYALIGMNTETEVENKGILDDMTEFFGMPFVRASSQSPQEDEPCYRGNSVPSHSAEHDLAIEELITYAQDNEIIAWLDSGEQGDIMKEYFEAELKLFSSEKKEAFAEIKRLLSRSDESEKPKLTVTLQRLALRSAQRLAEACDAEGDKHEERAKQLEKTIKRLNKEQENVQKQCSDLEDQVCSRDQRIKSLEGELEKDQKNAEWYRIQLELLNGKYDKNQKSIVRRLKKLTGAFNALHTEIAGGKAKENEEKENKEKETNE